MKQLSRIIVFVIIVIILVATFKFLWDSSRPEVPTYEIISPVLGNVGNTTTVTGNIVPRNEIAVKPEIAGIISNILKEVGDAVREGDIIATLRIIPDAGQLNAAESRLRVASINLERVSKEYERQRMLYENDVISRNEYEVFEANYRKAMEEDDNANIALEIVKRGYARNSNLVDNTQIRSRTSGTILEIPVKVGNMVIHTNPFNEGTTVAVVANMKDLIFKGTIDESDVGKIWEGMPLSISVGAIPNETIEANLEYISPKGTKESGSVLYEIKAAIKTPKTALLRADYSANAFIVIEEVNNVIKIPESSVEFGKDGSTYVFVMKSSNPDDQFFVKQKIEIGLYDGNFVEVKSGLTLKDRIRGMKIED